MGTHYDAGYIAGFFDEYGEREWERLEATPWGRVELEVRRRLLREVVRPGDRVLEVGAGPGRFTLELAGPTASPLRNLPTVRLAWCRSTSTPISARATATWTSSRSAKPCPLRACFRKRFRTSKRVQQSCMPWRCGKLAVFIGGAAYLRH